MLQNPFLWAFIGLLAMGLAIVVWAD